MPTSIDPPPEDDELECGHCGAHIYIELTRCPNCGIALYEPEDGFEPSGPKLPHDRKGLPARLEDLARRVLKRPYPADQLFGAAINQAALFEDLLVKVGGDRAAAERLVDFERRQSPQGTRLAWIRNAIQRWDRDNRPLSPG